MPNEPLVSIILSSYNQPGLLERAFNSLNNQTYENIEIIIVDDFSTDERNKKLIEIYASKYPKRVKAFFQSKNVGIAANKNSGFKLATGEYITYLDGDDTYYENKIASEVDVFLKRHDIDIVYSNFDIKNADGNVLSIWADNFKPAQGYIFEDVLLKKFPDAHTHRYELFKKSVLHDVGFYDEQLEMYEDFDLMLRYSAKYKVAYNNCIASSYYKNPQSIISQTQGEKLIEAQERIYFKYKQEIKNKELRKKLKRHLKNMQLEKQYYLKRIDFKILLKTVISRPFQFWKVVRIVNFWYRTKHKIPGH